MISGVPEEGLEPSRPLRTLDFESSASANSATLASGYLQTVYSSFCYSPIAGTCPSYRIRAAHVNPRSHAEIPTVLCSKTSKMQGSVSKRPLASTAAQSQGIGARCGLVVETLSPDAFSIRGCLQMLFHHVTVRCCRPRRQRGASTCDQRGRYPLSRLPCQRLRYRTLHAPRMSKFSKGKPANTLSESTEKRQLSTSGSVKLLSNRRRRAVYLFIPE